MVERLPFDDVEVAREALASRRVQVAGGVTAIDLTLGWVAGAVGAAAAAGGADAPFGDVSSTAGRCGRAICSWRCAGRGSTVTTFVADVLARGAAGCDRASAAGGVARRTAERSSLKWPTRSRRCRTLAHAVRTRRRDEGRGDHRQRRKDDDEGSDRGVSGDAVRVVKNKGNLNNHIGLPLSLMQLRQRPDVAVMELGMNHAGEISTLVAIAEPDVRVWTNVGDAHLGFFASADAIADAKAEILERADAGDRAGLPTPTIRA